MLLAVGVAVWQLRGQAPEKTQATAPMTPSDAGPADAPPKPRLAPVRITSIPPGATVVIDDKPLPGKTPTRGLVRVGADYQVVVSLSGYQEQVKNGPVSEGAPVSMSFTLVPQGAWLEVTTKPKNATVSVRGVRLGTTPLSRRDLAPGKGVRVRISKNGYMPIRFRTNLKVGEPTVITKTLEEIPKVGYVQIRMKSNDWATIIFRGRRVGNAPIKSLKLPVGSHRLTLRTPERADRRLSVVVTEGKTSKYSL